MKYGLFSNSSRFSDNPSENYEADLHEIEVADRAGFEEVWVSEHLGAPLPGAVTAPELLLAAAAARTERIRLGAGVRLLPLFHPLEILTQAGFNDQLSRGRYNLGIGPGFAGVKNTERRGIDTDERVPRTLESLEFILRAWTSTEPFDFDGTYYQGRNVVAEPRPFQKPHPPIAVSASTEMTPLAGERGYSLLLGHWDTVAQLLPKVQAFVDAADGAGVPDPRRLLKIARMVYVAEDTETAIEESQEGFVREFEWRRSFTPHFFNGYLVGNETIDDLSVDLLRERGAYIVGGPDDVADGINEFARNLGGFGTVLVVVGKDFATAERRERSLQLFAEKVAPQLDTQIAGAGTATAEVAS